jgi:hypothetical protein
VLINDSYYICETIRRLWLVFLSFTNKFSQMINNYVIILCTMSNDNRGLASADEKTRKRVASEGGSAPHDERGLEAADEETRKRVASEGGKASSGGGRKD